MASGTDMVDRIELSQGAGGSETEAFIKQHILPRFQQPDTEVPLQALDDAAVVDGVVFTTDSHTVQPLFFPGGDIGSLAVAGTVNDVAVMGAQPIGLAAAMVIEEGLPLDSIERVLDSMASCSRRADVPIVTGDTKVLEHGALQDMIVTTAGIGRSSEVLQQNLQELGRGTTWLRDSALQPGDAIILSGHIADHGIALLSFREGYGFETEITSDVAPVNGLMQQCIEAGGVVAAKDPTRGGLANTLHEMASKSAVGMHILEEHIPIREGTMAACEMLGIDPYTVGNEGKVVLAAAAEKADDVLQAMRRHPLGKDAAVIGHVTRETRVVLETGVGGTRLLEAPVGDPIPRIC
ncbi:MAG: hydrogenase expression/formation protein HypE [Thermoplasmatota archaeon]